MTLRDKACEAIIAAAPEAEEERSMKLNKVRAHKLTDAEAMDAWRRGTDAGLGFAPEDSTEDMSPMEAAQSAGMTHIKQIDHEGAVIAYDSHLWVVIANSFGPLAVELEPNKPEIIATIKLDGVKGRGKLYYADRDIYCLLPDGTSLATETGCPSGREAVQVISDAWEGGDHDLRWTNPA